MAKFLTYSDLEPYFNEQKKGVYYVEAKKLRERLASHSEGLFPEKTNKLERPNEPAEIKKYREQAWKSNTKGVIEQIKTFLARIQKSKDWNIYFSPDTIPSGLPLDETLSYYVFEQLPVLKNIEHWTFDSLIGEKVIDAMSVGAVMPFTFEIPTDKYPEPFPYIFKSTQVLDFSDNNYAIIKSNEVYNGIDPISNAPFKSAIFIYFDTVGIYKYAKKSVDGNYLILEEFIHNSGELPVWRLKGVLKEMSQNNSLFVSRFEPIADALDEAANEWSDFKGAKMLHLHPKQWRYTNQKCTACKGIGKTLVNEHEVSCGTCHGSGWSPNNPFAILEITPSKIADNQPPATPIGYANIPIDILKLMKEECDAHITRALQYKGLGNLVNQTLLNQSGIAKEVDRDEQFTLVYSEATDLVYHTQMAIRHIALQRYYVRYPNVEDRLSMQPLIMVPEKFDLLSVDYYIDQLKTATTAGVSPFILRNLQIDIVGKQFSNEPDKKKQLELLFDLDPLSGYTPEQKERWYLTKGCTQEDFIISIYLESFFREILLTNPNIMEGNYDKVIFAIRSELEKLAAIKIGKLNESSNRILAQVTN